MLRRNLSVAALLAAAAACASSGRLEKYRALSPEARDAYEKYAQFLTESQKDRYVALPTDQDRRTFLADLHIEDRIGQYPKYVQEAIWSRQVVVGMDKAAVFLTWGQPDEIERASYEASRGVEREVWFFRRGVSHREDWQVLIVNGQVVEIRSPLK